MLGLLLIYFIWKYYSELAFEYKKNKWTYAILGIALYYLATFAGGFVLGMIDYLLDSNFVSESGRLMLSLMALPFGLLSVWGLYKVLENRWSQELKNAGNDSLDSDLIK